MCSGFRPAAGLKRSRRNRLFVERARQRRPDSGTLCERLDRLPLAIELAAARTSAMSPSEILAGLQVRLDEFGAVRRQSPAHHRSLRAAVEWSHQLLVPTEQQAFRHLAVFVGGFDAEAGRAVALGLSLEVLARLVDKSVVIAVPGSGGPTRYRLLETVREYAHELLVAAEELDVARPQLVTVKAAYDPQNLFRSNRNIAPGPLQDARSGGLGRR